VLTALTRSRVFLRLSQIKPFCHFLKVFSKERLSVSFTIPNICPFDACCVRKSSWFIARSRSQRPLSKARRVTQWLVWLSHNPQLRERALNFNFNGLELATSIHSSLAAIGTLNGVTSRRHLSVTTPSGIVRSVDNWMNRISSFMCKKLIYVPVILVTIA